MKKILFCLLVLLPAMPSVAQTLNDGWLFEGRPVMLPHTWNEDAYTVKDYRRGTFWYERTLDARSIAADRRVFLKIDAASKTSEVFVNGQSAGTHYGGYTAATYDITPFLRRDGDNLLRIRVDNADDTVAPTSADFTFMGGIYRDVWLITKPMQHFNITDHGASGVYVQFRSEKLEGRGERLEGRWEKRGERLEGHFLVDCSLRNDSWKATSCILEAQLYAPGERMIGTTKRNITLKPAATSPCQLQLSAKNEELQPWSPEHPYLYTVRCRLLSKDGKTVLDEQEHPAAVRWYRFDADKGFFLNGQPYKLRGVCRHQDQKPYGVALTDDMHRRDFHLIKEMGANFIRLAHYPQDEAFLEMCDREGMLVWEEIPVVNTVPEGAPFADHCEEQLREMIRQHYNHPSIILWGYMNEILLETQRRYKGQQLKTVVDRTLALARRLEQVLHEEDSTRTSVMAFHGSNDYNRYGFSDIPQVVGWNLYQGWYGGDMTGFERFLDEQHRQQPQHPVIVSEYGAGSDLRLHSLHPQAFDFSMEYQQRYIEHYLPVIEQTPYICGASYWNFIDFSSANRDESMPRINNKGIVCADRRKKDVYYYLQALWRSDKPVLHIAARDWQERTSTTSTMPVKVYSNQPEVQLWHNGRLVGTKRVDNCHAVFDVDFAEGDNFLHAKAINGGNAIEDAITISFHQPTLRDGISINIGSQCHYQSDKSGTTWLPDQPYAEGSWGYEGGQQASLQSEIMGTDEQPLFQTMRKGEGNYRLNLPAATYELEICRTAPTGGEGQSSIYLLGKDSGGTSAHRAIIRRTIIHHAGGTLQVPIEDHGECLSALSIRQLF